MWGRRADLRRRRLARAAQQGTVANTSAAYAAFWKPLEPALNGAQTRLSLARWSADHHSHRTDGRQRRQAAHGEDSAADCEQHKRSALARACCASSKSALLVGNPKFDLTATEQKTAIAQLRGGATGAGALQAASCSAGFKRRRRTVQFARWRFEGRRSQSAARNAG